mmetsp:Transcript_477/g.1798  ORF Transcript_477/g.1798 Transcript_477/m.1798 type:complete len:222 (+) Transcript_477:1177-1842(+)
MSTLSDHRLHPLGAATPPLLVSLAKRRSVFVTYPKRAPSCDENATIPKRARKLSLPSGRGQARTSASRLVGSTASGAGPASWSRAARPADDAAIASGSQCLCAASMQRGCAGGSPAAPPTRGMLTVSGLWSGPSLSPRRCVLATCRALASTNAAHNLLSAEPRWVQMELSLMSRMCSAAAPETPLLALTAKCAAILFFPGMVKTCLIQRWFACPLRRLSIE